MRELQEIRQQVLLASLESALWRTETLIVHVLVDLSIYVDHHADNRIASRKECGVISPAEQSAEPFEVSNQRC